MGTFHQKCDGKGRTITIVKSEYQDHIFGGYTSKSWHGNNTYTPDNDAWLYSLRNTNGTPKNFKIIQNYGNAMYGNNGYGPTYGGNFDLCIENNCNTNNSSYTNLGYSYEGKE